MFLLLFNATTYSMTGGKCSIEQHCFCSAMIYNLLLRWREGNVVLNSTAVRLSTTYSSWREGNVVLNSTDFAVRRSAVMEHRPVCCTCVQK